jgi:transposase
MTARHSPLFTLESGQSGLGIYTSQRDAAQVVRWRQAAQDANAQPLLTMAEQKDLEKRHQADQREIKRLQQELRRKDKALAEAAALLIASKKIQAYWGEDEGA